ncbi:hypothetical protein [Mesorhizobium sp. CAU 1741]|uniref:hypothetical protein n=1 Tax=Mesorhizobium sp. CAU 1741 TaxID=3140366 RepID=UPI00325C0724
MTHPVTINTIGICLDEGYRIAVCCNVWRDGAPCNWWKWLDLEKLAAKLGRDHSSMHDDLVPHLYCLRCGSKDVGLRLDPPSRMAGG